MYSNKFLKRFWSKIDVRGEDECWPWLAYRSKGYGQITSDRNETNKRKRLKSPRVSLELKLQRPIKDGLFACHHCDNPPCCNPKHLYEGTRLDNAKDASERGLLVGHCQLGVENNNVKLTEHQVLQICNLIEDGFNNCEIARIYNVTHQLIWRIRHGKNWTHITNAFGRIAVE